VQALNLLNSSLSQVTLPHLVSTSQSIVAYFKLTNMQRVAAECMVSTSQSIVAYFKLTNMQRVAAECICLLFWH
jgi:hypothetical protein